MAIKPQIGQLIFLMGPHLTGKLDPDVEEMAKAASEALSRHVSVEELIEADNIWHAKHALNDTIETIAEVIESKYALTDTSNDADEDELDNVIHMNAMGMGPQKLPPSMGWAGDDRHGWPIN